MSLELKELLQSVKIYFKAQKILGLDAIALLKGKEKEKEERPYAYGGKLNQPVNTEKKATINVKEQLGIFDVASKRLSLEEIREDMGDCTRCKLHQGRTNLVFGEGNPKARLVFVGEGPGEEEDKQGRPFVGRAGQLLTKIIAAMGLKRSDVYICNVVKCRPPGNRSPEPDESGTCEQFLFKQLRAIDPDTIVCLGNVAAQSVLRTKEKLGNLRGKFYSYGKAKVMVTYHPAALLRNPGYKKPLWDDMQIVMKALGISTGGSMTGNKMEVF
ncbi:MAG TPA: uracil-DNA glycosylase [Thermodesulfobacteriota bacterium]